MKKNYHGSYVSVHLAALDDLAIDELVSVPLKYMDALHDDWWNSPAETRQL